MWNEDRRGNFASPVRQEECTEGAGLKASEEPCKPYNMKDLSESVFTCLTAALGLYWPWILLSYLKNVSFLFTKRYDIVFLPWSQSLALLLILRTLFTWCKLWIYNQCKDAMNFITLPLSFLFGWLFNAECCWTMCILLDNELCLTRGAQ